MMAVGSMRHQSQLIYNRPRAMLPALGKPLVVRMIDRLFRTGLRKFIVVVGEAEGEVASYLHTYWKRSIEIEFILKPHHMSTASVLATVARDHNHPFIYATYNSFTHANFPDRLVKQFNEHSSGLALTGAPVTLSRGAEGIFLGVQNNRVTSISTIRPGPYSKTFRMADMAACGQPFVSYLASPELVKTSMLGAQLSDIARQYILSGGNVTAVETAWDLPVENDQDLLTLHRHLFDEQQDTHILSELPYTVQVKPPVRIDPQVSVGPGAVIGPYTYLEKGSSVGSNAVVTESLILQDASISTGERIHRMIISTRSRISC